MSLPVWPPVCLAREVRWPLHLLFLCLGSPLSPTVPLRPLTAPAHLRPGQAPGQLSARGETGQGRAATRPVVPRLTTASGDISPSVARSAWEGGVEGPQPTAPGAPTGSEGFLQDAPPAPPPPPRGSGHSILPSRVTHPPPRAATTAARWGARSEVVCAPPAPGHLEEGTRGARAQRAPDRRRARRPKSPGARGPGRGVGPRRHGAAPPGILMETPAARGSGPPEPDATGEPGGPRFRAGGGRGQGPERVRPNGRRATGADRPGGRRARILPAPLSAPPAPARPHRSLPFASRPRPVACAGSAPSPCPARPLLQGRAFGKWAFSHQPPTHVPLRA